MGDHHFTLQVLAEVEETRGDTSDGTRLRSLNDCVAQARSLLADTGMTVAREDLALEAAFWAQLPGNFPLRPRKAPITSRNFAAMAPFHNYPLGRPDGNHWGEALTLLSTSARSPYYFSLHASDPADPDGGSRKDTGHTFICGPTGSGKTVFIGFLVAMLERQGATQIVFDKDRGLEILVRALNGEYLGLKHGAPTGFNPLQLPPTPAHVEFLKSWLRMLVRPAGGRALTAREDADLEQALRGTLSLARPARRLSRLLEFLDPTDAEGLHARLSRWCEAARGDYAWVFDNPQDSVIERLAGHPIVGFDTTEFLDHELTRAPVTYYMFHLVRQLLDGRRLVCWMDEFWRLLADPAFESFAREGPKTWRKLNGVMCLATQSASDVLDSPISRTIIEQTRDQSVLSERRRQRRGVHRRLRSDGAGVSPHQGAARAGVARVPGETGASQHRLPPRSQGLRRRTRRDLRARAPGRAAAPPDGAARRRARALAPRLHECRSHRVSFDPPINKESPPCVRD